LRLAVSLSADLFADRAATLVRLIGQHPAAVRAVRWQSESLCADELGHLEIETKHGQVVVFDHRTGAIYANPPEPASVEGVRQHRDLTAELPGAFNDRPVIQHINPIVEGEQLRGWSFGLSTGAAFRLMLDESRPLLLTD
jgi:hypothetical protein